MADEKGSAPEPAREQWATKQDDSRTDFARVEKPFKYQVGAWVLWVVGYACALAGILTATGALTVPLLSDARPVAVVAGIAIDLVVVLIAQGLWKKAGALKSAKRKQGLLGVVMACFAFAPMCLFFLIAKNAPGATKGAAVGAALFSVGLTAGLAIGLGLIA